MKNKIWFLTTWLWLLALAVLATIYGAWLIYPLEVNWLRLTELVSISKDDLLHNFNILLAYLTNPFSRVLAMPDFPASASGLKHFEDVKYLFHFAQAVFLLLTPSSWLFLKNSRADKSLFLHQRGLVAAALLPLAIGIMGYLIGFDTFFTLFHQVLFPGDTSWLFNPATDPIIWVLPQEFFLHCFILFFALYQMLMISLILLSRKQMKERLIDKEKQG